MKSPRLTSSLALLLPLALMGCAHQASVYSAPDHTALTTAKSKLYKAVTDAKAAHSKVTGDIASVKTKHAAAVETVAKIAPQVKELEAKAPPELKPDVIQVGQEVDMLRTQNDATAAAIATVSTDQQALSAKLNEAEAAKAEVDKLSTDYLAKVDDLTEKLNTAEAAWEKDSKEIVKLRTDSFLFKILSGLGVLAVALLAFLWFTGKIALKGAEAAAKATVPVLLAAWLTSCAPCVDTVPLATHPTGTSSWRWQNSGYSRSYGTWEEWQAYLNSKNAVWLPVQSPTPPPAWTHYKQATRYTLEPGRESLEHYLTHSEL